jgi:putative transposase
VGHSRRYCHVRALVRYPRQRTLLRPTDPRLLVIFLRSICRQPAQPLQLLRSGPGRSGEHDARDGRQGIAILFERVFKEFGLPRAIRTDNGVPFASPNSLFNLSKLSVWWLRLGIEIERIKPGHPQQNGRHERMHLTLKLEATKPAAQNFLQQQARFDDFIACYNNERPHQALNMQCPAQRYQPSSRPYRGLPDLDYPLHDKAATVTTCGRICFNHQKINLSQVFAGQTVGIKQTGDRIWLVSFMDYDLGYFDDETCRLEPLANPFGPKVLPMSSQ